MAEYTAISQKQFWTFRKLSFLYLVFIIFYAFSGDSNYVARIPSSGQTLNELNQRLLLQINDYQPRGAEDRHYKNLVLEVAVAFDSTRSHFNAMHAKTGFDLAWLKSITYFKNLKKKQWNGLEVRINEWLQLYNAEARQDLASSLHLKKNKKNGTYVLNLGAGNDFPNGAFPLLLGEMESRFLLESMRYLKQELRTGTLVNQISVRNLQLLQVLKNSYYLGESIPFRFYSRDSLRPTVVINGQDLQGLGQGIFFDYDFLPRASGEYTLEARCGDETITHTFSVVKPRLRFLESKQEIAAYVGIPLDITLDLSEYSRPDAFRVVSPDAQIDQKGNNLRITAREEGRLTLKLLYQDQVADVRTLVALRPPSLRVQLRDISGDTVNITNAHCLEAESPAWQVIQFQITAYKPGEAPVTMKSNTRFFRNEMHRLYQAAPNGTTFVFRNIKLINMNGKTEGLGNPFFFVKSL
ncbi:MAG: hypothetical protein EBR22_05415 [Cytophagia bacterium]|nr:hypothetical protein [Cytophagia bacterium]